jgi:molybdate transport system substrate-binding protein
MTSELHVLCAGAAQGLVKAMQATFTEQTGVRLQARFGAVGAMKEALLAGEPCDVLIVTDSMVHTLQASGELAGDGAAPLGRVRTGIAVRADDVPPPIGTPDELRDALLAASALYFPDPHRATAGIHFASVLDRLGIRQEVAERCRMFPNGATSMRELVHAPADAIGCTQITEILYTEGVRLVGALPGEFELATVYSAAPATRATDSMLARRFVELLSGSASRRLREQGGFEFDTLADHPPPQETR